MYVPNCRAYQRHDNTASTKKIRLSEKYWSLIAQKQEEIAKTRGVRQVSRPVALQAILDEAFGVYVYNPSDLIDDELDALSFAYVPEDYED